MRILAPLVGLTLAVSAGAQTLQSAVMVDEWTRGEARDAIAKAFKSADFQPEPTNLVELYKVRYWSTGLKGERTLLSGLVALPLTSKAKGLVAFMHGTTVVRDNVPSRMRMDGDYSYETKVTVLAVACGGYALAAPDYIGQGDSPGAHPYVLGTVNAASGIDILRAARELAAQKRRDLGDKLFVTGYSEGGGNAMWLARKIEEANAPDMKLTAAAPISGPYDLSGAQTQAMLATQTGLVDVATRLFFLSDYAYSLQGCYGVPPLTDMFVPSFASYVPVVFGREFGTDDEYVKELMGKGLQLGTLRSINRVLTPPFKDAVAKRDRSNPMVEPIMANDCFDWSPRAPLYLLGIPGDNMVVFQNTKNTIAAMRKRGLGRERVVMHGVPRKGLNHMNAIAPLMVWARRFFDEGFAGCATDEDP